MKRRKNVNFDINKVVHNTTLLEYALSRGMINMARMLVDRGAIIGSRKKKVLEAAKKGEERLKRGNDPEKNKKGESPYEVNWNIDDPKKRKSYTLIDYAQRFIDKENKKKTNESIGDVLSPKSFDDFKEDLDKLPPDRIIEKGKRAKLDDIVNYGIEKGGSVDQELLLWAIVNYKLKVIEEILKGDLKTLDIPGAIRRGIQIGSFLPFKMIMDATGEKPTKDMLRDAAINGNTKVVEEILKYPELDPSEESNVALSLAFHSKEKETIKAMLNDPRIKATLGTKWTKYANKWHADLLVNESLILDK